MSDTSKRDAVMAAFKRPYFGLPDTYALIDEIVRLRDENAALTAAVERVRAACENELRWIDAQLVLRALEETP